MRETRRTDPKYIKVANDLRRRILAGELEPGSRLPSYSTSSAEGITQTTIEHAHDILEREGLIFRQPRRGIFVRQANQQTKSPIETATPRIMQRAIGLLTGEHAVYSDYAHAKQQGWSTLSASVVDTIRQRKLSCIIYPPEQVYNEDIVQLLEAPPLGMVVSEVGFAEGELEMIVNALQSIDIPFVASGDSPVLAKCDRVTPNHEQGAIDIAEWLISKGCKRILNVWPTDCDHYWFNAKWTGYERAVLRAGLEPIPPVMIPERKGPPYTPGKHPPHSLLLEWFNDEIRRFAGYLIGYLGGSNPVDALMAHTDYIVPILASACRLMGRTPNEDTLLAGYDAYWTEDQLYKLDPTAPLVTVDKQHTKMGQQLVELLVDRVNGLETGEPVRLYVPPRLVVTN